MDIATATVPAQALQVVPITITIVLTVCGFIVGTLLNFVMMRSWFVTQETCKTRKIECDRCNADLSGGLGREIKELKEEIAKLNKQSFEMYGTISALAALLQNKAPSLGSTGG